MKRISVFSLAVVAVLLMVAPAMGQTFEVPVDTVVRAEEGSLTLLDAHGTPHDLVGETCTVSAQATNQSSVHPGNDLIIGSGDGTIALTDVEREPGVTTWATGELTLGSTITVSLLMGPDEVFSGGVTVSGDCTPATTTTTEPPTTTTPTAAPPAIEIEKTANPDEYGEDRVGHFLIEVRNPGPVDLTDVYVTDEVALAVDPGSDCANHDLPDLAVGETYAFTCTVGNLGGDAPFTNEATAFGTGPDGRQATDTDDATVFPPVLSTTITTQPPTTTPTTVPSTLPKTGVPFEQVRGFSIAGLSLILIGVGLLGAAAYLGRYRLAQALGYYELWLGLEPIQDDRTFYVRLRVADADRNESED